MILEKIRQTYPELTKSQRRLADYIAQSYRQAAFMTASRLARKLSLNEATVIRFAQRLGYLGYPDLIADVQAIVQEELRMGAEVPEAIEEISFPDLIALELETLQRVVSHIAPELAQEVLETLANSRRTYVLGQGPSATLAGLLSASLRGLGLPAECLLADSAGLAMMVEDVDEHCVVVGISAVFESEEIACALRYAARKGARTVALARSPVSPCAQAADLAVICAADDNLELPSIAGFALVIDALVQLLGLQAKAGARTERIAQIQKLLLGR